MRGFALLCLAVSAVAAPFQPIQVKIGQQLVSFDVPPVNRNGTVMVPIRSLIEAMGGTMKWNMSTNTLSCWKNARKFDVILNSREAYVNEKRTNLEEGAFIGRNRIYVPLKFAADAAGYSISQEDGSFVLRPILKSLR